MECVQLAAAFFNRKLACGSFVRRPWSRLILESFTAGTSPRQQAGWAKSGSKLHALQSFALNAMREALLCATGLTAQSIVWNTPECTA